MVKHLLLLRFRGVNTVSSFRRGEDLQVQGEKAKEGTTLVPVQLVAVCALLASPQRLYFWQAGVLVLEIPSGDAALLTNDMHFANPWAVKSWPWGWCEHPGLLLLTREELKTACVSPPPTVCTCQEAVSA